jgi:DNA-binding CsgD family transcriptional regulator
MDHFDGTPLRATESFLPGPLTTFLLQLERCRDTEDVWQAMLGLGGRLGTPVVDYLFATDSRNWKQAQFIRSTFPARWFDHVRRGAHLRSSCILRTHGSRYLTPVRIGEAYIPQMGPISAETRRHILLAAEMGLKAGVAFPLRMGDPGQAALLTFGGDFCAGDFDALLAEHGHTLHAAALSGHARYTELFKTEVITRNQLTDKQKDLLRLVGQGLMDKQIAHVLGISFSAVRQRLASVQQKTGTQNRADLAALAARAGLVPDPLLKAQGADLNVFLSIGDDPSSPELRRPGAPDPQSAAG